jgi:hypothetical protein
MPVATGEDAAMAVATGDAAATMVAMGEAAAVAAAEAVGADGAVAVGAQAATNARPMQPAASAAGLKRRGPCANDDAAIAFMFRPDIVSLPPHFSRASGWVHRQGFPNCSRGPRAITVPPWFDGFLLHRDPSAPPGTVILRHEGSPGHRRARRRRPVKLAISHGSDVREILRSFP